MKEGRRGEENNRGVEPNTSFLTRCFLASSAHSSILAWWIPWTEEPGGLWSIGSHRIGHNLSDLAGMHISWLTSSTGKAYQFCDKMVLLQKVPVEGIWSRINKGQDSFKVDKCIVAFEHGIATWSDMKDVRFKLDLTEEFHRNEDVNFEILFRGDHALFLEVFIISKISIPMVEAVIRMLS